MTSSATARARVRRQMRAGGEAAVPQIERRTHESGSHLRVVPQPAPTANRSRAISKVSGVLFLLASFITLVIILQATVAEQQLRLDALTRDLRAAEVHHDNLRQQRAELLTPGRLREEAVMLGMYQGMSTEFLDVPADVVAGVMTSTAKMNPLFADPSPAVASAGALAQMQPVEGQQP
jgi:hypothetical protein